MREKLQLTDIFAQHLNDSDGANESNFHVLPMFWNVCIIFLNSNNATPIVYNYAYIYLQLRPQLVLQLRPQLVTIKLVTARQI